MDPQCEDDCCRLCGFVFLDKRRKRNIVGEFAVVGVELLEGDKRAVCDTCRYRVEKSWKSGKAAKRKHPISPLSSTKGDKETERVILRKKPGHRLPFDYGESSDPIPIRPNRILAETPLTTNEVSCQTSRTLCYCRPSSQKGTCVKVGTQQYNNDDNDNNDDRTIYVQDGGRVQLPYKKDGPLSEILKRTPRGTEVLFCGHGLSSPLRGTQIVQQHIIFCQIMFKSIP